jgi:hypothetical protein
VVAALTIVRAYIAAGRPKVATGRIASFELWDDLVRQPLCWLRERMLESGRDLTDLPLFVDPADSIDRAASENPETSKLAALLNAWIATFGTTPTSPAQAITKATEVFGAQSVLFDALDEIAGQNSKLNVRILGRWLERHAGQLCTGLRLVLANKTNGLKRWTVVRTVERAATEKATPIVARVAPSCEIQDVDDTAGASQLDDVEIFLMTAQAVETVVAQLADAGLNLSLAPAGGLGSGTVQPFDCRLARPHPQQQGAVD